MLSILLLEDLEESANNTIEMINRIGYQNIDHIRDSRNIIKMDLERIYEYDVGILDWDMGELSADDAPNGLQAGKHLKNKNDELSLVVLTVIDQQEHTRNALKRGAPFDDYFLKTPRHRLESQLEKFLEKEYTKKYPKIGSTK